jgi:hypothetical protein
MKHPARLQSAFKTASNRKVRPTTGAVVDGDKPLSALIAEDNLKLQWKLAGSFNGYVISSSLKNPTP